MPSLEEEEGLLFFGLDFGLFTENPYPKVSSRHIIAHAFYLKAKVNLS
ncbi:hypothetical protein ANT_12830 [Anaerolinea thermophila UNI-1]|uniref:Uncharacterized protein n=1 Tax=Anaerolinea thermophila (strain DSM 14523 / JCM 11388 / NBRC 100420 / UNI-1) TaxID=926569 RepID=E8N4F3_ANATU|nr:hypothetical protein ANT_12830 [Anaerolinea thermophila UNI-1]